MADLAGRIPGPPTTRGGYWIWLKEMADAFDDYGEGPHLVTWQETRQACSFYDTGAHAEEIAYHQPVTPPVGSRDG